MKFQHSYTFENCEESVVHMRTPQLIMISDLFEVLDKRPTGHGSLTCVA